MDNNYKSLIKELTAAAKAYYNNDSPIMSDEDYDTKVDYLEDLVSSGKLQMSNELSQLLGQVSAGVSEIKEDRMIIHDHPMMSLGKAKTYDELERFYTKAKSAGATSYTLQCKLDGLALSAKYSEGRLIQLATRGDGVRGENLNYLINNENVKIVGLPSVSTNIEEFEFRGELYITDTQFAMINENRKQVGEDLFSNPRNAATGIVKASLKGINYKAELTFTAYSVYQGSSQVNFTDVYSGTQLSKIEDVTFNQCRINSEDAGFKITNIGDFLELKQAVERFGELRKEFTIPTDGVVIKPSNELEMLESMGSTSRHPNAFIAFKYPGEKATTTVEEIVISVGKTGKLTPQARITPVEVDGVIISNITCHNFSWLNEMGIRVGSKVAVTRANDVIPAISVVIDQGSNPAVNIPYNCPECGSLLVGDGSKYPKTLTCENYQCPSRIAFYVKSMVSRDFLYIEGLGEVAIEALVKTGTVKNIVDLFSLSEEILADLPTGSTQQGNPKVLGAGNAKNIMTSLNNAKENLESFKILAALNVEGVGPNTAKRLISHFGSIKAAVNSNPIEWKAVPQVGDSIVENFRVCQERVISELKELEAMGVKINDPKSKAGVIKGTFSISGSIEGFKNRDELVVYLESLGWEYHKSPKKNTTILIADPNGTSNKIESARKNGTKITLDISDFQ